MGALAMTLCWAAEAAYQVGNVLDALSRAALQYSDVEA